MESMQYVHPRECHTVHFRISAARPAAAYARFEFEPLVNHVERNEGPICFCDRGTLRCSSLNPHLPYYSFLL